MGKFRRPTQNFTIERVRRDRSRNFTKRDQVRGMGRKSSCGVKGSIYWTRTSGNF